MYGSAPPSTVHRMACAPMSVVRTLAMRTCAPEHLATRNCDSNSGRGVHRSAGVGVVIGVTLAVVSTPSHRTGRRSRRSSVHKLKAVSITAQEVAELKQQRAQVESEVAAIEERLSLAEGKLRKATAFQLPESAQLEVEVADLQREVDAAKRRLQAVDERIPAPPPGSVFTADPIPVPLAQLSADDQARRTAALKRLDDLLKPAVDAELAGGSQQAVVQAESEVMALFSAELGQFLIGFDTAEQQLPKRVYTLQELQQNGVDAAKLLSPRNGTLDKVRSALLFILAIGGAAAIIGWQLSPIVVLPLALVGLLILLADQLANRGFGELLVLDSIGRLISSEYANRVAQHEAGHFLVAYLVGILPKAYTLSAWEALNKYKSANVQAGTIFCDSAIQREVQSGKISGKSLDKFICIALGGVAVEYLLFGQAEGGVSDIQQLEVLFQSLNFDQRKTDANLRWAVLNTVGLLKRNKSTHQALAAAMTRGASVGECIRIIEESMASPDQTIAA